MSPSLHIALTVGGAIFLKSLILGWWGRFKERKASEPIPLAIRGGIYRPWGPVEKVQHYGWRATQVWLVYMAVLIALLIYKWTIGF